MDDAQEILDSFLFRGKTVSIDDHQFCLVIYTKISEPLISKTNESIFVSKNKALDLSKFNLPHQTGTLRSPVLEPASTIFLPLIHMISDSFTECCDSFFLSLHISLLSSTGNTDIHHHLCRILRFLAQELQDLIVRVISPVILGPVGFSCSCPIPFWERRDRAAYKFAEFSWRVRMLHTEILLYSARKWQD